MPEMGLRGVVRGKKLKTTQPAGADVVPLDRVNRECTVSAPNRLWQTDLSFGATWRGFVYVAFGIDAFARRIGGWRVSGSLRTDIAVDARSRRCTTVALPRSRTLSITAAAIRTQVVVGSVGDS